MAVLNESGDQADNFRNMVCCFRMYGRRTDAERSRILVIFGNKPVGQFLHRDSFFIGPPDHLVVDIREILYKGHIIAFPFQLPPEHIKGDERAGISDMEIVVNGRAAGIN